jgi:error-prone DNA polymerase
MSRERPLLPDYAELFCLSNFSFLEGASHAAELVQRAAELGYRALAITDECSVAGVVRAHDALRSYSQQYHRGLLNPQSRSEDSTPDAAFPPPQLLIGSYFRLDDDDPALAGMTLVVIAQDRIAYGHLCELITLGRSRCSKGSYRLHSMDFSAPPEDLSHLRALPGCHVILIPAYPAEPAQLAQQAVWLKNLFGNRGWMGLHLPLQQADDYQQQHVQHIAQENDLRVVAVGHVLMHVRSRKPLQDTLSAIRHNLPLQECGHLLQPNAEQHLRSRFRLSRIYGADALAATVALAESCHFSLDSLRYEYPDELVPAGFTPETYLRSEVYAGAHQRYPQGISAYVIHRIEYELALIHELSYEAYFLTVYDIVRFAREQGILCQGRGSAANSVVCYCLHVTEVNPEVNTLLFERFISRERGEPPDIDVDFEHQRREEVIQYIYRKYGRRRAALAAAVHTFRARGALRETGKALGIDPDLIDQVARSQRWFDSRDDFALRLAECGLQANSTVAQRWIALTWQLMGFPRHLSQHTGGFVIARDRLSRLVPVENAAMPERSVIQWDKDDLEALGLLKVDVLALGMLSMIRRALDMMACFPGKPARLQDIPREDSATYAMICRADTIGVFQIESRAQMSMLPRLQPQTFYDLVVQVAIVRPGPIQGGMVHPYLRRRQGLEEIEHYPNPGMQEALERTLGVPIFQEQVMQIAMAAADFTPGEADQLRRAMAAWKRKGGLEGFHERIVSRMVHNGYDAAFAERIFEQMKGFGDYGFPESHAASFAILAYLSSWIKCHEPAIFLCALLNSQPMGFYSPSQLVQDARRHRVHVLPADVSDSEWDSSLRTPHPDNPSQPAVRLGLSLISGLSADCARRISHARAQAPFADVPDLAQRARLNRHELQCLAHADALHSLAGHRRQALWQASAAVASKDLLQQSPVPETALQLRAPGLAEQIRQDYAAQGFSLRSHPLALLRKALREQGFQAAAVLQDYRHGQVAKACGLVTVRQRPGTAKGVLFMTLEDESGTVNIIVWPAVFERQRREALHASLLAVHGVWQYQNGVRHLIAGRLEDLSHWLQSLTTHSRDFC